MRVFWLVVLLSLPVVFAANIINSDTNITMGSGLVTIDSAFTIDNESISNLTLIVEKEATNFEAVINGEKRNCLKQESFVRCSNVPAGAHVAYSYETPHPLAIVGANTLFRYSHRLPFPVEKQTVTLGLPLGYVIPREKGKDEDFYITPTPEDVYSDGQRILLTWESEQQELTLLVVTKNVTAASYPVYPFIAVGSVAILAGLAAGFVILRRRKKKTFAPDFIDSEQAIVDILKRADDNEVWQKQIQHDTKFSKAKISRLIRNLEERGVVKKVPYGNTNKIVLKTEEEE